MSSTSATDPFSGASSSRFVIPDVSNIDIKKLGRGTPDYIPSPSARGRDIFQRLFFNTGALFLMGFGGGGAYGSIEGFRAAANPSLRIRINGIINGMSKRGSKIGNALGIIGKLERASSFVVLFHLDCCPVAFLHTSFIGLADAADLDERVGYPVAPIFAGIATGVLFGSSRGYRAAGVAGVIGAGSSYVIWYGGSYVYNVYLRPGSRY